MGSDHLKQVLQFVEKIFGKSEEKSFSDILNLASPISVHVIRPKSSEGVLTLFTLGLSAKPMKVPNDLAEHAYAELYMQLPGNWDYLNADPKWSWPIQLLLDLANYPHANDGFFAVPVTAVTNGDPAKPLGPGVPFTASGLVADEGFERSDGQTVHMFCVMPLFEKEAMLARENIPKFLNGMDASKTSRILNLNRPSFV